MTDSDALREIRALLTAAVDRLDAAGARQEALATYVAPKRILVITKSASMVPLSRVWRLGVLLLDRNGTVYATGRITRAADPGRRGYTSVSAEARKEDRATALRSGFAEGETVNVGWEHIDLDEEALRTTAGPLFLSDGRALVRWSRTAGDGVAIPIRQYLDDRVGLLVDPPAGA